MRTIICSPDNLAFVSARCASSEDGNPWRGLPVVVDRFMPTWKTYPRPTWWRRWFLREKERSPERFFIVMPS